MLLTPDFSGKSFLEATYAISYYAHSFTITFVQREPQKPLLCFPGFQEPLKTMGKSWDSYSRHGVSENMLVELQETKMDGIHRPARLYKFAGNDLDNNL